MDRDNDMLPYIEKGVIFGSVVQKPFDETFLGVHLLHWWNEDAMQVIPDWRFAGLNPPLENIETGVLHITKDNVGLFRHTS